MARSRSLGERDLYLAFDVDFLEGLSPGGFENGTCFAGKKAKAILLLVKESLPVVITDELRCVAIGFETQLLGDES